MSSVNISSNNQTNSNSAGTPNSNVNEFNKFLTNNVEFLQDKFLLHFGQEFQRLELLNKDKMEKSLKFIYDVFSFSRYQKDHKLNETLRKSLTENIVAFQKEIKSETKFGSTMAIAMLKYCIENNDMFAVHYDKKAKKAEEEEKLNQEIQQNRSGVEIKEQYQETEKENEANTEKQEENVNETKQSKQVEQLNKSEIQEESTPLNVVEPHMTQNEFNIGSASSIQSPQTNPKKHLKLLFDFYCKQQQNVGRSPTFDKISQTCQTMTLGKFIAFATACDLLQNRQNSYNQSKIDKKMLMGCWKKVAKEKREVGFDIFYEVLEQIKRVDQKLAERLGLHQPTSISKLKQNLKYLILPFNTRDPQGRELVSSHHRPFVPRLTGHSGKVEASLREEMIIRKEQRKNSGKEDQWRLKKGESVHLQFKNNQTDGKQGNIATSTSKIGKMPPKAIKINIKNNESTVNQTDFSFLSNLVSSDEHDDIFLKDYQLPISKAPFTHRYPIRAEHQTSTTIQNYPLKQGMTGIGRQREKGSRQSAIVPQLQKRIKQIQKKEKESNKKLY